MYREDDLEIGRRAIEKRWITQAQMEACLDEKEALADALVRKGLLQASQIVELLREIHPPLRPLGTGETFGKYKIVRELGRGGMGVVYEAQDLDLARPVALKILSSSLLPTGEDKDRFIREARLAGKLKHPGIVAVHDVGLLDDSPFFTMDLIEGVSLDKILDEPDLRRNVDLIRRVAVAVHAAHEAGIIHRDLKPANILVDKAGEPHVMDFGLARDLSSQTVLTQSGMAMGTPWYMSPEQAMGLRDAMDARTDVYSLGVILYQTIMRRLPFPEESFSALLVKVTTEDPPPPHGIDRALGTVCMKAMARERQRRYATAGEFAADLGRWLKGEPILAKPPGTVDTIVRSARRHPTAIASIAVGVLVALTFALFLWMRPGHVRIQNPSGASLEINGDPVTDSDLTLKRGSYRITGRLEGHRDFEAEIQLGPGETRTVEVAMVPRSGLLSFAGLPDGTRVTLWGPAFERSLETPAPPVPLVEGVYRVRCWAPRRSIAVGDVVIRDGQTTPIGLELHDSVIWSHRANDSIVRAPVVADLDGDGRVEVAFLSKDRHLRVLESDGKLKWPFDTKVENHGDLQLLEGNLLFASDSKGLQCVRGTDGAYRFFLGTRSRASASLPVQGPDSTPAFLVTDWEGNVAMHVLSRLLDRDTAPVWEKSVLARIEGPAVAGDLHGDMDWEVAVATHGREIVILQLSSGKELSRVPIPSEPASPMLLADVDTDWFADLTLTLADGSVVCVAPRTKKILWTWKCGQPSRTKPAIADFDGDGRLKVVVGSDDGHVYCLNGKDGTLAWKYATGGRVRSSIAIADVDGDQDLDVVFGSDDDRLYVIDGRTGRLAWFFACGEDVIAGPVVADLDGDGRPEVIFASDELYAVRVRRDR